MLRSSSKNSLFVTATGDVSGSEIGPFTPFKATMIGRVELLARCILSEYRAERSGVAREEILGVVKDYLITDLAGQSFSLIHQSCQQGGPIDFEQKSHHFKSISAHVSETFLRDQGPGLIDEYKDGKWWGRTSCGPISQRTMETVNEVGQGCCADIAGISHHAFNLVLVESQPYLVDFTFDQFLDYERVRNWQSKTDDPVNYAGVLIMPVDRMNLKFDKTGSLVD